MTTVTITKAATLKCPFKTPDENCINATCMAWIVNSAGVDGACAMTNPAPTTFSALYPTNSI
ncbi:MAG: hypothetical protein ABSG25_12245 [Bryobacteraceae bacterium]